MKVAKKIATHFIPQTPKLCAVALCCDTRSAWLYKKGVWVEHDYFYLQSDVCLAGRKAVRGTFTLTDKPQ